ncbi:hypothetical protein GCM10027020_35360 [Nocardioides salsibiostraticola]
MHRRTSGQWSASVLAMIALLLSALTAVTWSGPASAGTAAISAKPATAVDPRPEPVLTWQVSRIFTEGGQLRSHVLGDGATEAVNGVITFPRGKGTYDPATGETAMRFQGWVEATNYVDGSPRFAVKIEDPWIQIDAAGNGRLRALVTSTVHSTDPDSPDTVNLPTRVEMTTFRAGAADWSLSDALYSLTTTPAWAGVVPPNTQETQDLGFAAGTPVDGKAFSLQFLQHLNFPPRPLFIADRASNDALKAPADITVQAPNGRPGVAARVTGSSYAGGVKVSADGFGFTSVTNEGDDGIVVAIAEAGRYPDLDLVASEIVTQVRVRPQDMLDDDWAVDLTAATADLDAGREYAVYTWQSPDRSNTTQDTETPLAIDFSTLTAPPRRTKTTTKAALTSTPAPNRFGKLRIKVRAAGVRPAGKVKMKLRGGQGVRKFAARKVSGSAITWRVPRLRPGRYKVIVKFVRTSNLTGSRDVVRFFVRR